MRHRLISGMVISMLLALAFAAGCKTQTRGDADVAADVQRKLSSDAALQNKPVAVQAANGIVTLSGAVDNDAARAAAANDAATVAGVKTVVNNIQVQPVQAQAQPLESIPEPAPQAAPSKPAASKSHSNSYQSAPKRSASGGSNYERDYSSQPVQQAMPAAPVTPPPPSKVSVPAGTTLAVRLIDGLDSERNHPGDTFRATLNSPVTVDDNVVIPADADIQGRVVDAKNAAHFSGSSALVLELTKVSYNGKTYTIQTNQWSRQGKGRGANTAGKVGGGAALGAVIGAIAGGGKGAAIGSVVGAGAGTGVQAATRGEQIKLSPEALVTFQLQSPVTVMAASENERNAGRHKLDQ